MPKLETPSKWLSVDDYARENAELKMRIKELEAAIEDYAAMLDYTYEWREKFIG